MNETTGRTKAGSASAAPSRASMLAAAVQRNVVKAVAAVRVLAPDVLAAQRHENHEFAKRLDAVTRRQLDMLNHVLRHLSASARDPLSAHGPDSVVGAAGLISMSAGVSAGGALGGSALAGGGLGSLSSVFVRGGTSAAASFATPEDILERWGPAMDMVDQLLEATDSALDVLAGRAAHFLADAQQQVVSYTQSSSRAFSQHQQKITGTQQENAQFDMTTFQNATRSGREINVAHAANIERPQLFFKDDIDNSSNTPFVPKILRCGIKPHAAAGAPPLPSYDVAGLPVDHGFPHPYSSEIELLARFRAANPGVYAPPTAEPTPPVPCDQTPAVWVDTVPALESAIARMSQCAAIAVDLEHHSYRSYEGLVCLVQVTTDDGADFLIDALALRLHLYRMNHVLADPKIVKVFHGANMDIIWLQRDLGCYVVNMFDTHCASRIGEMPPPHSLANLVQRYCPGVTLDKQFQLADWRMRPVPSAMRLYAQSDTHYLLYIYQRMRAEILAAGDRGLLEQVLLASDNVCRLVYKKEKYDFERGLGSRGWLAVLTKASGPAFNQIQVLVLRYLHRWRDEIARESDESTGYVMPNRMLVDLARAMPMSVDGVLAICNPTPPMVRIHAEDIAILIRQAREATLNIPSTKVKPLAQALAQTHQPNAQQECKLEVNNEALFSPIRSNKRVTFSHARSSSLLDNSSRRSTQSESKNVLAANQAKIIARKLRDISGLISETF